MKHATSRILFGYWDALRGERLAPERREVQPSGMRHILADTFMLGVGPDGELSFRLAGTRVCALFCRDLRATAFDRVWCEEDRAEMRELSGIVGSDAVGALVGVRGVNENGSELPLELLLLPLRHRGRADSRLVGALSPASLPSWAGLVPLASLQAGPMRIIEPSRDSATTTEGSARKRNLFVLHQGGLA